MAIRNSAKAVIIADGKILLTKCRDDSGVFYLLPGGGQEKFEDLHEALRRECLEEISCQVDIGDILFIRDYIGKNSEFAETEGDIHQVEFMFACSLAENAVPRNGSIPDDWQVDVEWVPLSELKHTRVYPSALKQIIHEDGTFESKVYLGAIN